MSGSDDETPQLSAATLAALQEFYTEKDTAQEQPESQEGVMPQEDWQLSQFWYSDETAVALAKEALEVAGPNGSIACVSCPTMYQKLRQLKPETCKTVILEYDERFHMFKEDFVFFDYNKPLELPRDMEKSFDIVVVDPPFLSEECLTKTAISVRWLTKGKILLCTGAVMEDLARRLMDVKVTDFMPRHSRNLANEFRCFTNYTPLVLNGLPS